MSVNVKDLVLWQRRLSHCKWKVGTLFVLFTNKLMFLRFCFSTLVLLVSANFE